MALTPTQTDALLQEVDDAVRRDDIMSFWARYGRLVGVAVGLALAGYGAWLLWLSHQHSVAEQRGEDFAVMLKSATGMTLDKAKYDALAKGSGGYRAEADLVKAAIASGKGDLKSALATYDAVRTDSNTPEPIKQLALLRRTALDFDNMKPQQVIDALKELAVPGGAWFGSAGEMSALAYLKMNKKHEAADLFASINRDPTVTDSIRLRAGQMAGMLGVSPDSIKTIDAGEQ